MEAPCNNLAVYQAGRWQQLVAIQHRTLPILLPPPRLARTVLCFCSSSLSFSLWLAVLVSFFIFRFLLSSLSLSLSFLSVSLPSSPLPCRDSSLPWFTPVHLLIRFKSGPLAPLFPATSRASWSNRGRSSLTLLSRVRLSRIVLEIFVVRTH